VDLLQGVGWPGFGLRTSAEIPVAPQKKQSPVAAKKTPNPVAALKNRKPSSRPKKSLYLQQVHSHKNTTGPIPKAARGRD
jgi:hypothetical protein